MKTITVQPLSPAAFQPYGCYQDLYDIEHLRRSPPGESGFYPDLVAMNLSTSTLPSVSISKVKKREPIVAALEYHKFTAEGLMPLDGDCIIYVGRASREFTEGNLTAFLVPKGVFVKLNPGTIHGTHFPVDQEWVRVLVLLPERTYGNDTVKKVLAEEEKALLVY